MWVGIKYIALTKCMHIQNLFLKVMSMFANSVAAQSASGVCCNSSLCT